MIGRPFVSKSEDVYVALVDHTDENVKTYYDLSKALVEPDEDGGPQKHDKQQESFYKVYHDNVESCYAVVPVGHSECCRC